MEETGRPPKGIWFVKLGKCDILKFRREERLETGGK